MAARLTQDFFAQETIDLSCALLGQYLVHRLPAGDLLRAQIVETEAYLGADDPSAHSFNGRRTPRTEVMFGPPGFSYVYFIYGMYFCLNVVSMLRDIPEAILIRAVQLEGKPPDLANGPGKLCRALMINSSHNNLDLSQSSTLWFESGAKVVDVVSAPRIGIGTKHDAAQWPLRFGIAGHPALSRPFPKES